MKNLRLLLLGLCVVVAAGCGHIATKVPNALGYEKVTAAQAQVAKVQQAGDAQVAQVRAQLKAASDALAVVEIQKSQESANHLFSSQMAFTIDPAPNANEQIMNEEDAAAALTLPSPDAITVSTAMARVKALLADKQHLIDNLSAAAAVAKTKADQLATQETTDKTQIKTLAAQKDQAEHDRDTKVAAANQAVQVASNDALSKAKELLSSKAAIDAAKKQLMEWAGALAVAFIIAAIFSPVFKTQFIELAVIFGGATIALPFVQPWMIEIAGAVGLLLVAWHFVSTHTTAVAAASSGATTIATPTPAPAVVTSPASVPVKTGP